MKWFLVIVFLSSTGIETLVEGWYPRQQPNQTVCELRAEKTIAYMTENGYQNFKIYCAEFIYKGRMNNDKET